MLEAAYKNTEANNAIHDDHDRGKDGITRNKF